MKKGAASAARTACLLFLLTLCPLLYAGPGDDDEDETDDGLFFFEELFIFEEAFSFTDAAADEEPAAEESVAAGQAIDQANDEVIDETFDEITDKTTFDETIGETLAGEEIADGEESAGEEPGDEDILLAEENPDSEEGEEDLDDYEFLFEAPPLVFEVPTYEIRSIDVIFPSISWRQKAMAMSREGLRRSFTKDESPALVPNPDFGIDLLGSIMKKNPSHLIEALVLVPYNERELDLLDVYNALGRIEKIKEHTASWNGNDYYIFTESTRIAGTRNRRAIPDPLPAVTLPFSETMYLRLKEISFGNLFIRGDVSISMYGITYSMTNFTDVRYFLVPIMRAERFTTILYLEPVKEGILIYCMSGFYLPGFIADRVNLTPNINIRIEVFINWITSGLREQENAAVPVTTP